MEVLEKTKYSFFIETIYGRIAEKKYTDRFFDVYELKIEACRACLGCQKKDEPSCVIKDDRISILNSMMAADLIVYAAPLKAVMDQSVYATCKYYYDDSHGPSLLEGKRLALITTCGYPVEKGADLYEEMIRRYCKHCRMIYSGMLVKRQRNLKEIFMDSKKEQDARTFANQLIESDC